MKASKSYVLGTMFAAILVGGAFLGIEFENGRSYCFKSNPTQSFASDFRLRRNEVLCAHQGINSFHIWNGDISVEGFRPLGRADQKKVVRYNPTDKAVHAYPPWHNVFAYFYGWLPEYGCIALLYCLLGVSLSIIISETQKSKTGEKRPLIDCLWVLSFLAFPAASCFFWCNYSVLILALIILMARCLRRDDQILAGLCWSIAMIKPQLSLLLFWPLLFERKYITIITAIAICCLATIIAGNLYQESPINLILNIPNLAIPSDGNTYQMMVVRLLGSWAKTAWSCCFFVLCGIMCYLVRHADNWYERYSPVALCVLLWTFGQPHDLVLMFMWYCTVDDHIRNNEKRWKVYGIFATLVYVFTSCWSAGSLCGVFQTSGIGWIYRSVDLIWLVSSFGLVFSKAVEIYNFVKRPSCGS